ncbi:MAG: hypothetical protein GTO41_01885, partial [Burkholderiales bacterium]|nr:hypothetical protein [Burkholderiales bacterium]
IYFDLWIDEGFEGSVVNFYTLDKDGNETFVDSVDASIEAERFVPFNIPLPSDFADSVGSVRFEVTNPTGGDVSTVWLDNVSFYG